MIIGGYQPFTLTDYPGRPAAAVFVQGCNLRCPFCHNGALRGAGPPPPGTPGRKQILQHLAERRGQLGGVVLTGGEPILSRDLPSFLRDIRRLGYRVKLDTNATRPDRLAPLLEGGLVDYVAADVKAPPGKYHELAGTRVDMGDVRRCIALIAESGLPHLFRTTWVPDLLREDDARRIRAMLPQGSPHTWQRFVRENAADPALRRARR